MNKFLIPFILAFISTNAQVEFSTLSVPVALKENANSILLKEEIVVDVTQEDKMTVSEHSVRTIFNKLGNRHLNAHEYYDENSKIKKIEAYIYDALGNEIEHFKQKDFKDISATDGFSLYNDTRVLFLDYTPTTYPYTVVYTSETETGNTAFIRPWAPLGGYVRSTKESTYTVKFNPNNKPKYLPINLDGYSITIDETPNELVFSASNLSAIRFEELSPSFYNIAPSVKVALNTFYLEGEKGYGKNWKTFGKWMNDKLLSGMSELDPSAIAKVKALVKDETTNEGKARKIYQFLQDKVRYISVQIGIGGWKPMLAKDVDNLSYGDCKALTNYTKALLDAVGVPSYYTVIYGGERRDITKDFTAMQGNHAILGVPDEDEIIWLECTDQKVPFGYLGDFTSDRDALIVTPEGGEIVRTKKYTAAQSLQKQEATITLNTLGDLNVDFKAVSYGLQYGDKHFLEDQTQDDQTEYYKEDRWGYINGFSINNINLKNDKKEVAFTEELEITIPQYLTSIGNDKLLCLNVFNQSQYIPSRNKHRKNPIEIQIGFTDTDKLYFNIPPSFKVDQLPENTSIENKFGSYKISFSQNENKQIVYTRHFSLKKGQYPKEDYSAYRTFLRKVAKLDKTKILLTTNK